MNNKEINLRNKLYIKKLENETGITLISLVVTIVILIILAGVSINATIGEDGLVTKAKKAEEKQEIVQILEKLELQKGSAKLANPEDLITLQSYLDTLKSINMVNDADITDAENENAKTIIVEGYAFLITDLENGNIQIEYQGKAGKLLPKIQNLEVTSTTNSITVKVTASRINGGNYKYYIKNVETGEEYQLMQTSKEAEYTFTGLIQEKDYKVQVEVTNSNGATSKETEGTIKTTTVQSITQADLIFTYNPNDWTNETVTASVIAKIEIQQGNRLQTSKDAQQWSDSTSQTYTENGNFYVRIFDGTNGGSYTVGQVSKIDTTKPANATISISNGTSGTYVSISATVTHTDNQSGVNIANSKWKTNSSGTTLGIDPSSYTGGTFSSNKQAIGMGISESGTYYLHVLSVDNAGNRIETIRGPITVSARYHEHTSSCYTKATCSTTRCIGYYGVTGDGRILYNWKCVQSGSGNCESDNNKHHNVGDIIPCFYKHTYNKLTCTKDTALEGYTVSY